MNIITTQVVQYLTRLLTLPQMMVTPVVSTLNTPFLRAAAADPRATYTPVCREPPSN